MISNAHYQFLILSILRFQLFSFGEEQDKLKTMQKGTKP